MVLISVAVVSAAPPKKASTKNIKKDLKSMQWMALLRTPTLAGNGPTIRKNWMDGLPEYEITNGAVIVSMIEHQSVSKTSFIWSHESGLEDVQTIVLRSDGEFEDDAPVNGLALSFHVKTGMVKLTQYVDGKPPVVTKEWPVWQGGIPRGARHNWFPVEILDRNGTIILRVQNNADNPNSVQQFEAQYNPKNFPDGRLMVYNEQRKDPADHRCFFRNFCFEGPSDPPGKQTASKN